MWFKFAIVFFFRSFAYLYRILERFIFIIPVPIRSEFGENFRVFFFCCFFSVHKKLWLFLCFDTSIVCVGDSSHFLNSIDNTNRTNTFLIHFYFQFYHSRQAFRRGNTKCRLINFNGSHLKIQTHRLNACMCFVDAATSKACSCSVFAHWLAAHQ